MKKKVPAASLKQIITKLLLIVAGMFGFGFVLVPLYEVFCEYTGANGKTNTVAYDAVNTEVDKDRLVKVQFLAMNNAEMTWSFKPSQNVITVNPGVATDTVFYAKNPESYLMTAQAVPSISPGRAAAYFKKIECFCFDQQILKAGESAEMGLQFVVEKDLPEDIHTITLTYTIFDVTPEAVASK